jgi:hypothetical protein
VPGSARCPVSLGALSDELHRVTVVPEPCRAGELLGHAVAKPPAKQSEPSVQGRVAGASKQPVPPVDRTGCSETQSGSKNLRAGGLRASWVGIPPPSFCATGILASMLRRTCCSNPCDLRVKIA